jgi:hypothetical protein
VGAPHGGRKDLGILPDEIRLTLGIRDILVLRNLDEVPQIFGPTLMMPGQSFRLPFEQASEYQFACTAHASGQMRVIVYPYPATPWARIMLARYEDYEPNQEASCPLSASSPRCSSRGGARRRHAAASYSLRRGSCHGASSCL